MAAVIAAFSLLVVFVAAHGAAPALGFTRSDFPEDFVFGAATSVYQYEGAVAEDGRSPSIWDTFLHAGLLCARFITTEESSTGDRENAGQKQRRRRRRRVSQDGREAVNPKELQYYNNLMDELVRHGVQIHVMLYQLDLPQVLEDEYGGWLSPRIVEDFTAYADLCFREFGDRVLYWTTLDEANIAAFGSYDTGQIPPG